ncbi:hypothetical protein CAPTEDRAFT_20019 [Capitella teleta]|uniref:Ribokinase n=1 Tax=Capitella teleta TaxID=283909 RepID=R7TV34_CAPTE|nr:hypothetical protein CAPTEDRAFT_20019 [Capitella teleta]|eukprot:ELT97763.1 hypothetical protein CAPTEDRAFT_20019 [Capitella teleta]
MDVVVVGSCMKDLISYVPRLPDPGETIVGTKFTFGYGGKGANQCVMAARLGAKTSMIGKVGEDDFGRGYLKNFEDNGVNIEHTEMTSAAATGVATIAVNDDGQNAIIIVKGANDTLTEQDVANSEDVISKAKVLICQLEISPHISLAAIKLARKHGVVTILNPAPAVLNLDPSFYSMCDYFCPNETEAEILSGLSVKSVPEAMTAALLLLDKGCRTVVLTLGEQGAVCVSQDRKPIHIPAKKVKQVDSTGAGDAFVGAFAFYVSCMSHLPLAEMLKRSGEIAGHSVQFPGTQTSYPHRGDLQGDLFFS